jgi:hypothetical protein
MGWDCVLAKDCPCTKCEHITVVSEHGINDTVAVHQGEFCFSLTGCLQAAEARASAGCHRESQRSWCASSPHATQC